MDRSTRSTRRYVHLVDTARPERAQVRRMRVRNSNSNSNACSVVWTRPGVFGQAGTGGDAIGRARPIREAAAAAAAAAASWPLLSYSGQWAR